MTRRIRIFIFYLRKILPKMKKFITIISIFLGSILLLAGFSKLITFKDFINIVNSHDIIPDNMIIYCSVFLILIEIAIGILLFSKKYREVSACASCFILSFFSALNINALLTDKDLDCGCFGFINIKLNDYRHVKFDLLLLFIFVLIFLKKGK